jgi:hypothetical protein
MKYEFNQTENYEDLKQKNWELKNEIASLEKLIYVNSGEKEMLENQFAEILKALNNTVNEQEYNNLVELSKNRELLIKKIK